MLDKGNYACSVFLDFAKASDTVDHRILLSKLPNYGIRGVAKDWFEFYLTNSKQNVKIGNILSEQKFITYGVPTNDIKTPPKF